MPQRRTRTELEELKTAIKRYLSFKNSSGETLTHQEISLLLDVSRSRVTQIAKELHNTDE